MKHKITTMEWQFEKRDGESFDEYRKRVQHTQNHTGRKIIQLIQCDSVNPFWIPNTDVQVCGKCQVDKTIKHPMKSCPTCHVTFKWI